MTYYFNFRISDKLCFALLNKYQLLFIFIQIKNINHSPKNEGVVYQKLNGLLDKFQLNY